MANNVVWEKNDALALTQDQLLAKIADLYRVFNVADHETNPNAWLPGTVAGHHGANHLDGLLRSLIACGSLTHGQVEVFYNTL